MTDALAAALRTLHAGPRPFPGIVGGHSAESAAAEIATALTASNYSLIPTEELAGLQDAAEAAYDTLTQLDRQALNPGHDRLVKVTVEGWRDGIRPVIAALRAALEAKGTRP